MKMERFVSVNEIGMKLDCNEAGAKGFLQRTGMVEAAEGEHKVRRVREAIA